MSYSANANSFSNFYQNCMNEMENSCRSWVTFFLNNCTYDKKNFTLFSYCGENTQDLVDTLQNLQIPANCKLMSFDSPFH